MKDFFYELTFFHKNVEEYTFEIFEMGLYGAQIIDENTIKIFLYDTDDIDAVISKIESLGFVLKNKEKIKNENWIIKCPQELESLIVDKLEIIPVVEQEDHNIFKTTHDNDLIPIKIIPGMAFGTGHHETTKNVLKLLQHEEIQAAITNKKVKNALDVGTGSAILAIATNVLYNIPVLAFDNDETTIQNAQENIKLNNCDGNISLFCGEIDKVSSKFDLILANIYAEILVNIYKNILNSCTKNTYLLLSGIQEIKKEAVISTYSSDFDLISLQIDNSWCSMLFKIKK